jgi:hypothetical protein
VSWSENCLEKSSFASGFSVPDCVLLGYS